MKVWCLPHHGVYHQAKLHKICILIYCSENYAGRSIKKELITGPDLTNQVVKSLIKSRQDWNLFIPSMKKISFAVKSAMNI